MGVWTGRPAPAGTRVDSGRHVGALRLALKNDVSQVKSAQVGALEVHSLEPQLTLVSVVGAGPCADQHVHHISPGQ